VDTSDELVSVRSLARRIDTTLKDAQRSQASDPPSAEALGTNGIWRRVRFLNGGAFEREGDDEDTELVGPNNNPNGLLPVRTDALEITGGLVQVNEHLTSICEAPVLETLGSIGITELAGLVRSGPC
jgi:hypothetical protein